MTSNKKIALNIIRAQVTSDAGKGIYSLGRYLKPIAEKKPSKEGYETKQLYIEAAVEEILGSRNSRFHFCVATGYDSDLIYFEFRDSDGKRRQISFHVPDFAQGPYWEKVREMNSYVTEWNGHRKDQKDSRNTAIDLAEMYGYAR